MSGFIALLKIVFLFGAPLFVPCYARFLRCKCEKAANEQVKKAKSAANGEKRETGACGAAVDARLRLGQRTGEAEAGALAELYERGFFSAQLIDGDCELTLGADEAGAAEHELALLKLLKSAGDGKRARLSELEKMARRRGFAFKNALMDFDGALDAFMLENGWYELTELDAFGGRKLPVYITAMQIALMGALAAELNALWQMGAITYVVMAVWFAAYRLTRAYFRKTTRLAEVSDAKNADDGARQQNQHDNEENEAINAFARGLAAICGEAYSDMSE